MSASNETYGNDRAFVYACIVVVCAIKYNHWSLFGEAVSLAFDEYDKLGEASVVKLRKELKEAAYNGS